MMLHGAIAPDCLPQCSPYLNENLSKNSKQVTATGNHFENIKTAFRIVTVVLHFENRETI
jgi:hypothetical protein